jgi:hypothetical protein
LRRVIILVGVIIAVPVMMWTTTIFVRSLVERPKTFRHLTLTEPPLTASLPPEPQAALKGPLALPPGDAPRPAASPTGPAETAPNAPAAAPGEATAVTDSAQSAATAETASSEAVTPEPIRGGLASLPDPNSESLKGPLALPPGDAPPRAASPTGPAEIAPNAPAKNASSEAVTPVQRDRPTATEPATGSMAWVGPIPLPRVRPVDAPVDTPLVPSSPLSGSSLFAPAPYGGPGSDSAH